MLIKTSIIMDKNPNTNKEYFIDLRTGIKLVLEINTKRSLTGKVKGKLSAEPINDDDIQRAYQIDMTDISELKGSVTSEMEANLFKVYIKSLLLSEKYKDLEKIKI